MHFKAVPIMYLPEMRNFGSISLKINRVDDKAEDVRKPYDTDVADVWCNCIAACVILFLQPLFLCKFLG